MRSSGQITATLLMAALMAALAAVGCSKGDDTSSSKGQSQPSAKMTTVSRTDESPKPIAGGDVAPAKPAGPASYADGETAYRAGKYSDARRVFEQYTKEKPANAWGHFMLGLASWKTGDPKQAESAFEEALRIDPKHVKSLVNLSRVLIEQKRFDDAIDKLTKAGELDPGSADVHRLLGRSYAAQGKFDDAGGAYRTAIAMDGKDVWSMNNLGLVFIQKGRFHEAVPPLARAVELRKDVAIFQNNLGMALENTGRFTAAAEAYKGALAADPNYARAQQNLTRVQAVKVSSEEPFDLAATAKRFVESMQVPADDSAIVR